MNLSLKKLLKDLDVLYISEHDGYSQKIKTILRLFFKDVLITNNKQIAINTFNEKKPSVIIVDINIKDSNGLELVKYIKNINNKIPLIILTENKEINNLVEAVKLNIIDYLFKPLDIDKLIYALNNSAKKILNNGQIQTVITNNIIYSYLEKCVICMGEKIVLTKNEVRLLELFLSSKNEYIKKEDIKKHIWLDKDISESAFKSLLNRLSNKVGKDTIKNSFGVGYGIFV